MKRIIALSAVLLAFVAGATNMTNYPQVVTFDASTWFLLSSVPNSTNYNLPGNYVASTSDLNGASNTLYSIFQSYQISNPMTNMTVLDTNGFPFFTALNGKVSLSASALTTNSTVVLLGVDTNSGNIGIPAGYAGVSKLAATSAFTLTDTNGVPWRIIVDTNGTLTTTTNL